MAAISPAVTGRSKASIPLPSIRRINTYLTATEVIKLARVSKYYFDIAMTQSIPHYFGFDFPPCPTGLTCKEKIIWIQAKIKSTLEVADRIYYTVFSIFGMTSEVEGEHIIQKMSVLICLEPLKNLYGGVSIVNYLIAKAGWELVESDVSPLIDQGYIINAVSINIAFVKGADGVLSFLLERAPKTVKRASLNTVSSRAYVLMNNNRIAFEAKMCSILTCVRAGAVLTTDMLFACAFCHASSEVSSNRDWEKIKKIFIEQGQKVSSNFLIQWFQRDFTSERMGNFLRHYLSDFIALADRITDECVWAAFAVPERLADEIVGLLKKRGTGFDVRDLQKCLDCELEICREWVNLDTLKAPNIETREQLKTTFEKYEQEFENESIDSINCYTIKELADCVNSL